MSNLRFAFAAAALVCSGMASANGNLLKNGSFEDGFAHWTVGGGGTFAPMVVTYGPAQQAFTTTIFQNDAVSKSPDIAGTKGALFVDDVAKQTLSQKFIIGQAGTYIAGFNYLFTEIGFTQNPNGATMSIVGSNGLFSTMPVAAPVLEPGQPGPVWTNVQTTFVATTPGEYTFSFTFTPQTSNITNIPFAGFAKDIAVDQAFVMAVPEPETYALALVALLVCGGMARLQRRAQ